MHQHSCARGALVLAPLLVTLIAVTATPARAADAADAPTQSETRAVLIEKTAVRLTTRWDKQPRAELRVGKGEATVLAKGMTAGTVVAGHGRVVIALAVAGAGGDEPGPPELRVQSFAAETAAGFAAGTDALGEPTTIARSGAAADEPNHPFAVAATETPDGFTVFFQELDRDDPTAAHTFLAKLDTGGAPTGPAVAIAVPWSLAAAAWNGTGYHLALLYTEATGMRLSMVSLTAAGAPEQHPDWSSRPGFVADVHLVAADGAIRAIYRGGKNGDRIQETDVTAIRQWGGDPGKAKDKGALPWSKVLAVAADGKVTKLSRR
jgi:hypothetical protein